MNHQNLVSNMLIRVNRKKISKLMFRALAPRQSEGLWTRLLQSTPTVETMNWPAFHRCIAKRSHLLLFQSIRSLYRRDCHWSRAIQRCTSITHAKTCIQPFHFFTTVLVCILLVSPFRWTDICCIACWEVSWLWCVDWIMWIKRWSRHAAAIHEPVHSTGRHQDWPRFLANPWFCRLLGAQPRSTFICRNYCSFPCAQLHNYCSFSVGVEVVWSAAWF